MKAKQIRTATKNLSFENAIYFIENLGFELEQQQNLSFCKSWSVKNNKEFFRISCTMNDLIIKNADVKFCFN
jgi:hypothetical protein